MAEQIVSVKDNQKIEVGEAKPPLLVESTANLSVAPTTTSEEDLHTSAKRDIDWKWESTQSFIAKTVVVASVLYALTTIFITPKNDYAGIFFAGAFGTIIGFYFARTNHLRTGGVAQTN